MRLPVLLLLLATTACVHGFNPVSVKHWYPPPDTDTQQLCTGDRASRCTDQALALIEPGAGTEGAGPRRPAAGSRLRAG